VIEIEKYLSKKDVCNLLGIGQTTLDKIRKRGLPDYLIGGKVKFKASEVERWVKEQNK